MFDPRLPGRAVARPEGALLRAAIFAAALLCAPIVAPAMAQTYYDSRGTVISGVVPMVGCASSGFCLGPVSASNPLPVAGSFSATLVGFAPGGSYATFSNVGASSSAIALPTGATVVVYNTGLVPAYVTLGGSGVAATTGNDVVPAGGWMAFTVGSNTYLAAITASGSTSLNLSGGSGLPTGSGGGGGGTVAQGTPNTAANAWPMSLTDYAGVNQAGVNASHQIAIQAPPSLPLPSGAATAANQSTAITALGMLNTTLGAPMQQTGGSVTANLGTLNGAATAAGQANPRRWIAGAGQGLTWGSAFGSEINSIVSGNAIRSSISIANGVALDQYMDVSLALGSITTTAGAPYIGVYLCPLNQDGSTYCGGQFG